jgi:hypothetical protein
VRNDSPARPLCHEGPDCRGGIMTGPMEVFMSIELILIIVLVLIVLGGGYGYSRW